MESLLEMRLDERPQKERESKRTLYFTPFGSSHYFRNKFIFNDVGALVVFLYIFSFLSFFLFIPNRHAHGQRKLSYNNSYVIPIHKKDTT